MTKDAAPFRAVEALPWALDPLAAVDAWPADQPLAALLSAGDAAAPWARWSILARPVSAAPCPDADPIAGLDLALAATRRERAREDSCESGSQDPPHDLPFIGGWIGWLSYDLSRVIEPRSAAPRVRAARDDRDWPLMRLLRCPGAYVHDSLARRWWAVGDTSSLPPLDPGRAPAHDEPAFRTGGLTSATGRKRYESAVRDAINRISRGDVYQVNLAHRLSCPFSGSPRALFRRLVSEARPWFGACIEDVSPGRAVLSLSPELLIAFDPATRAVVTRPIKGTRRASEGRAALLRSEKDAAELVMIVDLMRNDLGRVCDVGSVRVPEPRAVELHAGDESDGVLHTVATVSGRARDDASIGDLLRAVFPGGSITGAPKIMASRIIDELEPVRRGPYCGAVGFVSDCGRAAFNIAIRTASISPIPVPPTAARSGRCSDSRSLAAPNFDTITGVLDYSVGAGIVADSDPAAEWRETLAKAGAFRRALLRPPHEGKGAPGGEGSALDPSQREGQAVGSAPIPFSLPAHARSRSRA